MKTRVIGDCSEWSFSLMNERIGVKGSLTPTRGDLDIFNFIREIARIFT